MLTRSYQRLANGLRPIKIQRRFTKYAPGSVLVSFGDTQVLVTATLEDRVPRHILHEKPEGHGWITAEYSMLPGATQTRNNRDRLKISGRTTEIQRLIGRSLRASVDLSKLGQRTLTIDADVLQADGGTRVAAITGGYVAVADAIQGLLDQGLLTESPIIAPVAAVSVGMIEGMVLLDLDYSEDFRAEVDANVVMNGAGNFIEFQATSEKEAFSRDILDEMASVAEAGIQQLLHLQQEALSVPAIA